MVFSLFRKTVRADDSAGARNANASKSPDSIKRASGRRAAQEAARMTAEKIDRIESEMIADVDDRARVAGMDDANDAQPPAQPAPVVPPLPENDDDVKLALAKLRKKARKAKSEGKRKPSAEELLAELTLREATRMGTVADVLAADQETLMGVEEDPDTDPGLDFALSATDTSGAAASTMAAIGLIGEPDGAAEVDADDDLAIDVIDGALPDELEEAAILFSNAQFDAANAVLRDTLSKSTEPPIRAMNWFMLFDLYRVTGDRESFEQLAIDYANEVEKSPPGWNNELIAAPKVEGPKPGASPSSVEFASMVGSEAEKTVDQLLRAAKHKRECSVDFSHVTEITADAAAHITRMFEAFEESGHPLAVSGLDTLETVVRALLQPTEGFAPEAYWKLALQIPRARGEQVEFEDLSIEYCVAYEISPPPWVPYAGQLTMTSASDAAPQAAGNGAAASDPADLSRSLDAGFVTLRGELCGKIDKERAAIRHLAGKGLQIRIDCRRLRRMDFMAAGELLNEQLALQAQDCTLHFDEPNYLVYALMHVMGMQETARITRRRM